MVSKYPGEVSILVLGPLTNFALAMKRDSSFASKVKRVVILGGSFFALGNVNPAAEANVSDYHLYNTFSYSIWYEIEHALFYHTVLLDVLNLFRFGSVENLNTYWARSISLNKFVQNHNC
ncbi:hypothetical protein CsSME_00012138 [Camellia sinensis var. sinensis]